MGSRIAAHIANAGLPVVLLDIVPPGTDADAPKPRAQQNRPRRARRPEKIQTRGLLLARHRTSDHHRQLRRRPRPDRRLRLDHRSRSREPRHQARAAQQGAAASPPRLDRHQQHQRPAHPRDRRRHADGAAPPLVRHALLQPSALHAPARSHRHTRLRSRRHRRHRALCDLRLGKAIVHAHDTPNFIANRIGTFSMSNAIRLMQQQGLSIEEVDTLTGSALGWPKTGTFRLGDMVGVDVMAHVAKNFSAQAERIRDERAEVALAPFIAQMLEKKVAGRQDQTRLLQEGRQGRRRPRPAPRPRLADPRLQAQHAAEISRDRDGEERRAHARPHRAASPRRRHARTKPPLSTGRSSPNSSLTAANRVPEIADNIVEIDQAMKAGYNWELGPFEMFDAAGVRATTEKMRAAGAPISANVEKLLAYADKHGDANPTWYKDDASVPSGRLFFDPVTSTYKPVVTPEGVTSLAIIKKAKGVIKKNPGASVIDLGDGVAAIELHSKMNALGDDIVNLITQTLKPSSEHGQQLRGLRHHRRLRQLLRRRQPHATPPRHPGRGVGRGRDGHPRLPEHDAGHQVLPTPCRRRALRHVPRRRQSRYRFTPPPASLTPSSTWASSKPASA